MHLLYHEDRDPSYRKFTRGHLTQTAVGSSRLTENEAEMTVERDAISLCKPTKSVRAGWAAAAERLSRTGDDSLVWLESGMRRMRP
jgi:hypothetical protein